jgi:CHASE2 domain-containing sensor protein
MPLPFRLFRRERPPLRDLPRWIWWLAIAGNAASGFLSLVSTRQEVPIVGRSEPAVGVAMAVGCLAVICFAAFMLVRGQAR